MGTDGEDRLQPVTNFGENQRWYAKRYRPASEAEILNILARHPGATVRPIGAEHSWSGIAANSDIALDLSALNSVALIRADDQELVSVGAGCRIQDLLDRLHAATDRTLPTLGAIKKQTISGAISTGTHGSGRQSLLHFVTRVRAVVFDAGGRPEMREFTDGPELLAARCGLGCVGIIVSVDLLTVLRYRVAETIRAAQRVEDILPTFAANPLTSFTLSPYEWTSLVFKRKLVDHKAPTFAALIKARVFRLYSILFLDVAFHLAVLASRATGPAAVKFVQKFAPRTLKKNVERIDGAEHILANKHDLFRHEEMEVFVKESDLPQTLRFLRASIAHFAGIDSDFPCEFNAVLEKTGLSRTIAAKRDSFVLHYPLFCRRVLPEHTMISMAADSTEALFSISIFTYDPPRQREPYYAFCSFVAHALCELVGARLHWGKHFPLAYSDVAPLYPRLDEFRAICRAHDPNGLLRNAYTARVLNLPPDRQALDRRSVQAKDGSHSFG